MFYGPLAEGILRFASSTVGLSHQPNLHPTSSTSVRYAGTCTTRKIITQEDKDGLLKEITAATSTHVRTGRPSVRMFIYVAYKSPKTEFGLFAGESLSVTDNGTAARPELSAGECLGTYGGMVCGHDEEALDKKAVYRMAHGKLPAWSGARRMYVYAVFMRLLQQNFLTSSTRMVYVDGGDMRAGDGVFANSSCDPNVELTREYVLHSSGANGSELDALISLYKPVRYALPFIWCIKSIRRPIEANQEITVFYNDPTVATIEIHEPVGGCFCPYECKCGAPFCMGDTARRLIAGRLTPSDCLLFQNNTEGPLKLNVELIKKANCAALHVRTLERFRVDILQQLRNEELQQSTPNAVFVPLTAGTIQARFVVTPSKHNIMPMWMQDDLAEQ